MNVFRFTSRLDPYYLVVMASRLVTSCLLVSPSGLVVTWVKVFFMVYFVTSFLLAFTFTFGSLFFPKLDPK